MRTTTQEHRSASAPGGCKKHRNRGCLALFVLFIGWAALVQSLGSGAVTPQPARPTPIRPTPVPTIGEVFATNTQPSMATVMASQSEDNAAFEGLLRSQLGVVDVGGVTFINGVLLINLFVDRGYNDLDYARTVFDLASAYYSIEEFALLVSDGTQLFDYMWNARQNEWRVSELTLPADLITPQATVTVLSFSATAQSTQAISTAAPQPTSAPVLQYTCNGIDDLNCGDFSRQWEAQAHMAACGDEDALDADGDGEACEP